MQLISVAMEVAISRRVHRFELACFTGQAGGTDVNSTGGKGGLGF